ncbi:3-oxoacyl-[acyl-carrier-protein] synthase, mitochondrial [Phlebotomus argentipes]|uniref:3-oxoacyl-[acyl-carrier-protein] synthase, mitochondrial n=1 Tax=Phlebotomus argentipes TaxID=94469 RepID=UPI0028935BEA|nr:3-oxoacyl-[acyl-carrier-protein] synthase, mitochondrial [Phlebotomus argentipes]
MYQFVFHVNFRTSHAMSRKILPFAHSLRCLRHFSTIGRENRRVVVTGVGCVSPVGVSVDTAWTNILSGQCGVVKLTDPAYEKLPSRVAAQIPREEFDLSKVFTKSELKSMSPAIVYSLVAAKEALTSSQWTPTEQEAQNRTGVSVGIGMVDFVDICEANDALRQGYNRVSPFFVPRILPNMAAGQISIKYGFRGPNHAVSTACATGAHAIGDGFRFIQRNEADVMVCGAGEASISPLAFAGFCRLRALSTAFNDDPQSASRPFDAKRDGFVMGEGAAILILEELEHAKSRNAPILGEILGYGCSGDASHLTSPREDGLGAFLAMQRALEDAQLLPEDISYINAHATSTPIGDAIECRAISRLFGDHASKLAVSSTKGAHGHLLGSAGNLEALFTLLACRDGQLPPTINLSSTSDDMKHLNFVANRSQSWPSVRRRIALKNAFGFGGTNACLCLAEFR